MKVGTEEDILVWRVERGRGRKEGGVEMEKRTVGEWRLREWLVVFTVGLTELA